MVAYMFSMSFGAAVNTRVSNELGAGHAIRARTSAYTALGMVFCTQSTVSVVCLLASKGIVQVLTNNEEVEAATLHIFGLLAGTFVPDGLNAVSMGVLRASGRQGLGAALNLVGYWCLGVPLSALLGLHLKWSTFGFWTSLLVTSSLQSFVNIAVLLRLDWHQEVARAQVLVGTQNLWEASIAEGCNNSAAAEEGSAGGAGTAAAAATGKGRRRSSSGSNSIADQSRQRSPTPIVGAFSGGRDGTTIRGADGRAPLAAAADSPKGSSAVAALGDSVPRVKFLQGPLKWLEQKRKQQAEQRQKQQQQARVYEAVAAEEPLEEKRPLLLHSWRSLSGRLGRQGLSSREGTADESGLRGSPRASDSSSTISLATLREQRYGRQ
jgi:hypothetical protein